MSQSILIVEDETKIGALMQKYLEAEGFDVLHIVRGDAFKQAYHDFHTDLILLDIQLPGESGLDICKNLRQEGDAVPVIMLTAKIDEVDRLIGLELGADDYICKPFSPREVVARIKAVLRRTLPVQHQDIITVGALKIDNEALEVFFNETQVMLTPLEFDILSTFVKSPRRVFSRSQLIQTCKGTDYPGYERNMDTHIKNVRKKLKKVLDSQDPFVSVYGVGYRLNTSAFELLS